MTESRVKQLNDLLADAYSIGDNDQIEIIKQELFTINPHYVKDFNQGGFAKGSAEGSTIKMKPMKMKSGGLAKRGYGKARK
jgi:hypothetical protein|tara:strand:+ start:93 stop:335 length:243 start_codon:yes stop_codon:yes gene_type:complete